MSRLPRRSASEPGRDVPAIVSDVQVLCTPAERREARLRLREDVLVYWLWAKRLRRNERLADSFAKFVGGSLLTTSVALLFGGHGGIPVAALAFIALLSLVGGTIFAAIAEYHAAAWDNEADRIVAALEELEEV